jgi:hypothetical protein
MNISLCTVLETSLNQSLLFFSRSARSCGHLLRLLQDNVRLEVWASLRVKPEVQGGKIHHWIGSHDQRKRMGKWKLIVTRRTNFLNESAATSFDFVFIFVVSLSGFLHFVLPVQKNWAGRNFCKSQYKCRTLNRNLFGKKRLTLTAKKEK